MNALAIAFAASFSVNALFFVVAAIRRTDTVTDLSYGLSFALTALVTVLVRGIDDPVRLVAAALVVTWALRLAGYLFRRILRIRVDHRFDGRREDPVKFAKFWILQALSTVVVMLPAVAAMDAPPPDPGLLHGIGFAVWLAGLLVESVADHQKWRFKISGAPGFVRTGLWSVSRHPNYLGEMLVWWGIWLYALPSISGWWHLAALGPAAITALLLFVTGIPLLERSADTRYGSDPAYRAYKDATPLLLPRIFSRRPS